MKQEEDKKVDNLMEVSTNFVGAIATTIFGVLFTFIGITCLRTVEIIEEKVVSLIFLIGGIFCLIVVVIKWCPRFINSIKNFSIKKVKLTPLNIGIIFTLIFFINFVLMIFLGVYNIDKNNQIIKQFLEISSKAIWIEAAIGAYFTVIGRIVNISKDTATEIRRRKNNK